MAPDLLFLQLAKNKFQPALAIYCANEVMYCKRVMEDMKAQKASVTFYEDKRLLNLFDNKLVDILGINGAYHMAFPTVKQLLYKL